MSEVLRVTTWRDPPKYRGLTTLTHIDGTGISLKVRQRCEYCGRWTIRYDTVECKPLHSKCQQLGRPQMDGTIAQEVVQREREQRIYENRYVDAKFLEERP